MPTIVCDSCPKTFHRKPSDIKEYNYCSRKCRAVGLCRRRQMEIEKQFGKPIFTLLYHLYCIDGLGIKQISKKIGVSDRNLWDWFNDLGIERRERSDAVALQWVGNDERKQTAGEHMHALMNTGVINISGERNPAKLPGSREKIRQAKLERNWMKGRHGPLSPVWQGGKVYYYGGSWDRQRNKARERDNYTCQRCGVTEIEIGRELDVHHKIKFRLFGVDRHEEANNLSNLICLCNPCHTIVEREVVIPLLE